MTISFDIGFGRPAGGYGAVVVTPDRLLTFSESRITAAGPLSLPVLPGGQGPLAGAGAGALPIGQGARRYTFRINPNKLSVTHEKQERYQQTKWGWERQYWGNALSTFRYSGTSGVFRQDAGAGPVFSFGAAPSFDIRTSLAWQKFKEFEDFYRRTGSTNIFMYFIDYPHEWEGSLSEFSFERSATSPFALDYSFRFTGLPIDYAPASASQDLPTGLVSSNQAMAASQSPSLGSGAPTVDAGIAPLPNNIA